MPACEIHGCCRLFLSLTDSSRCHSRRVPPTKHRNDKSGVLTTSLPEDVFSLLKNDAAVLEEIVFNKKTGVRDDSKTGAALWIDCMLHVFYVFKQLQLQNRLVFVMASLFDTCAASNDFLRMSEMMEALIKDLTVKHAFLRQPSSGEDSSNLLVATFHREGQALVASLIQDAVMAAERTHVFIIREVQSTSIPLDFFGYSWEEEWTQNEVAGALIDLCDENLNKIKRYLLNEYLYQKAVIVTQKAVICFYVRCLVNKADTVTRRRRNRERIRLTGEMQPFRDHDRALRRMADDIKSIKQSFQGKVDGNTTMLRILADDISVLEIVQECLAANEAESLESFIVVIHKRTGADPLVTRFFVGDLWTLTTDKRGRSILKQTMKDLKPDLQMVTTRMQEVVTTQEEKNLSFVRMDCMLKALYEDRVAQNILPACWGCLPKVEASEGNEVVVEQIRTFTRNVVEMKWVKHPHDLKKHLKPLKLPKLKRQWSF